MKSAFDSPNICWKKDLKSVIKGSKTNAIQLREKKFKVYGVGSVQVLRHHVRGGGGSRTKMMM